MLLVNFISVSYEVRSNFANSVNESLQNVWTICSILMDRIRLILALQQWLPPGLAWSAHGTPLKGCVPVRAGTSPCRGTCAGHVPCVCRVPLLFLVLIAVITSKFSRNAVSPVK